MAFIDVEREYVLNRTFLQSWSVKKYSYKNNARLDYGFLYLLTGRITYTFGDKRIEMRGGDVIYLPKGSYYEAEFDISRGEVKNYLINFDILGDGRPAEEKEPILIFSDGGGILESYFKNAVDAFGDKDKPLLAKSFFYLLLHTLSSVCGTKNGEGDVYISKGAELLRDRYDISVDEVAREMHLSRSAFQKRFKKAYGVSPVAYRTAKRLEKAKVCLDTTDMPIKEIAEELGFYDLSYFYKVFEKKYNLPPKKYRDSLKYYL